MDIVSPLFAASVDASSLTEEYSYAEDLELQEILGDRPSQADDDDDAQVGGVEVVEVVLRVPSCSAYGGPCS